MIKKYLNRLSVLVSFTFCAGISLILSGVVIYWIVILVPSIKSSEYTKAELLITYMTGNLEIAMETGDRSEIENEMRRLQLLKDPETQENLILSIEVKPITGNNIFIAPSDEGIVLGLFTVSSPLFSSSTNSLLGEVIIEYNHIFHENLLNDAREKLIWFLGGVILIWMSMQTVMIKLLKPFSTLNKALDNIDFNETAVLQNVKGFMTKEISEVVNAIENLLSRLETTRLAEKESQESLKKAEERLDLAVKGSQDGLWDWLDVSKDNEWWSPQFYELLGYENGEINAGFANFKSLLHPEDIESVGESVRAHFEEKKLFDMEFRLSTKSGDYKWFRSRGQAIWDENDKPVRMSGSIRDISLQKQAQLELKESEKKYRSLFHNMVRATAYCKIIVNEKGNPVDWVYLDVNESFEKMIGKNRDEIIDKKFSEIQPAMKRSHPDLISINGEVARTGKVINFERYLEPLRKWASITVYSPAKDYFVAQIGDIAEQKKAEEIMKTAQAELEIQVARRTADLSDANEEIKRFAYVVSHDMKSPLINIKGFAGELRMSMVTVKDIFKELKPLLKEDQIERFTQSIFVDIPESLTFIETSVTRMDNLINAIMKLSRIGRRELVIEEINTDTLVNVVINAMLHQIGKKGIKVRVLRLPDVKADKVALEQIFGNLLENAVKYLDPDRPGEIEISGEQTGGKTVFKIVDNGRGISAGDIVNIFKPFIRVGERTGEGEGMGLAFVNTLVRNHGGTISCESEVGKGSSFSFTITDYIIKGE